MTNKSVVLEDLKHIWHPCSQMKDYETLVPLIPIKSAKHSYLYDFDGNRYLDSISSWWVNLFGHQNEYINRAIIEQLKNIEHVIFAGFTHKSIVDLSSKLIALTPKKLNKIFFADNGSSAVEISLKMAFQYFKNSGEIRDKFISLENSYHGETMGALAVGDVSLYKEIYKEILITTLQAKSPALTNEDEALEDMQRLLIENDGKISAVIIEPLVQCAGSMKMYDATYITELSKLCKQYGVFLIADEIAVGFGRTGSMFAFEQTDIVPDFLLLSKGITGGYLPLSAVMTSDDVYNRFYCDYNDGKSFLDSHSYTGNALATAAANATLDIFKNDNVIEKNKQKISYISKLLDRFGELQRVQSIDQRGMIASITLNDFDYNNRENLNIYKYCLKNEVLIRPLGDTIYFMPHYTFGYDELDKMADITYNAIKSLQK
jgi:adenosylmethionine-8-amino-7-oxononanoate aminotransferase